MQVAEAICLLAVLFLGLGGCGLRVNNAALFDGTSVKAPVPVTTTAAVPVQGYVGGHTWSVTGASIQLYAIGTSGTGSSASPLLAQPVRTDNSGGFLIDQPYTCPSPESQLYIIASGGNPGLASGADNQAIRLLTFLGSCAELSASTLYPVNEVTTVGTLWPLSRWITSDTQIGADPGDPSFPAAITKIEQLVNLNKAVSPGTGIPAGYAVQSAKLYTLASDLHACVASGGGAAGDGTPCGQLFSLTTAPGGAAPADTFDAALRLAPSNQLNVQGLFQMVPANAAYQPDLAETPIDWNLDLVPIPTAPAIEPPSGTYSSGQLVTLSSNAAGAALHYTLDGSTPSIHAPLYSVPLVLSVAETLRAIALTDEISSSITSASFDITAPHLVFTVQPSNIATGAPFSPAVSVSVVDSAGAVVDSSTPITLNLQSSSVGAVLSGTAIATSVHGVAVFPSLSVANPGTGYTLVATSPGLAGALSRVFAATTNGIPPLPIVPASLLFTTQPSDTLAGVAFNPAPVVRVVDSSGNLAASSTAAVTLAVTGGSAALSGPVSVNAIGGIATFPLLSIASPGSAYTITASSSGFISAVSNSFNISTAVVAPPPISAGSLLFTTQPSDTLAGVAFNPAPVVRMVDSSGNLAASSTAAVTLAVTGGSAALSGPVSVNAIGGIATFPLLSIASPGSAYTITASSSGFISAVSNSFNISTPVVAPVAVTILENSAPSLTASPGTSFNVTYNWQASPLTANDSVFVHFVAANGSIAFNDNHQPPVATSQWSGTVSYTRTIQVPESLAAGTYSIIAGLTSASGNIPLLAGPGVTSTVIGQYQTGTLTVASNCSIASFGAVGDGVTDNATAIQGAFNYAAVHHCIAYIPAGTFAYSGTVTATSIAVAGAGAASILAPLDPTNEAVVLSGGNVSLSNLVMISTAVTRLSTPWSGMVWIENANNYYVENTLINNSSSVGIMSFNSYNGYVSNNTVENTLADAITQINGSYGITISSNRILNSGDDGISNNSYIGQPLDHDIAVQDNTILNNLWGRGLEVSGGSRISFTDNYVNNPDRFSDMYIASESEWSTQAVDSVTVSGNTFIDGGPNQGTTILYNSQGSLYNITGVTIHDNRYFNPPYVAVQFAGNGRETGILVENNTDYSSGTFSATGDPLSNFTSIGNRTLSPTSYALPSEPVSHGCNFAGC